MKPPVPLTQHNPNASAEAMIGAAYMELRRMAQKFLSGEHSGHTLQATALVHEACARLIQSEGRYNDAEHFLATAARTMRRILVDHARRHRAVKRGSGARASTHNDEIISLDRLSFLPELEQALEELRRFDPRQALIVELRFFGGLSNQEIGKALDLNRRAVGDEWQMARAWLFRRLKRPEA